MRVFLIPAIFAALLFAGPEGKYSGTWTSDGGVNTGKVSASLTAAGDGSWQGELTFTFQDQQIKPKSVTAKVEQERIEFLCEEDLDGFKLRTRFSGTLTGKELSGKYQTVSAEDGSALDSGVWKVSQQ